MEATERIYSEILSFIKGVRRRLLLVRLSTTTFFILATCGFVFTFFSILFYFLSTSVYLKTLGVLSFFGSVAFCVIYFGFIPLRGRLRTLYLLRFIEERSGVPDNLLVSAFQLWKVKEEKYNYSQAMIEGLIERAWKTLNQIDPRGMIPLKTLKRSALAAGCVLFSIAVLLFFSSGIFRCGIHAFCNPLSFPQREEGKEISLGTCKEELIPPLIKRVEFRCVYPSYTGLSEEVMDEGVSEFDCLEGTKVHILIEVDKPLQDGWLVAESGDRLPLFVKGRELEGELIIKKDISFEVEVMDICGLKNEDPVRYSIRSIPDRAPRIKLVKPERDIELPKEMLVQLAIKVQDDVSLKDVNLVFWIKGVGEKKTIPVKTFKEGKRSDIVSFPWSLEDVRFLPGDEVAYLAKARDTKGNQATTRVFTIRFPSLVELYHRIVKRQIDELHVLREIKEEQEVLREELDKVLSEMRRKEEFTKTLERDLKEVVKKEQELKMEAEEVLAKMKETMDLLQKDLPLRPETVEKYLEVQRRIREMLTQEMQDVLKKLQEVLQGMRLSQKEKLLMKAQFSEEGLRKRLDEILEMLERVRLESDLEMLSNAIAELRKAQEVIRKKTEDAEDREVFRALAKREMGLLTQAEHILKDLHRIMKDSRRIDPITSKRLRQIEENERYQGLPQDIQEAADGLSKGDKRGAVLKEKEIEFSLSLLQKDVSEVRGDLIGRALREVTEGVDCALYEALEISKTQEGVSRALEPIKRISAQDLTPHQALLIQSLIEDELYIKTGIHGLRGRLEALVKKSLFLPPTVIKLLWAAESEIRQAEEAMEREYTLQAKAKSDEAMKFLNLLIIELLKTRESLKNARSSFGLQEAIDRLKQLAELQREINQRTEGVSSLLPGLDQMRLQRMLKQLAYEQSLIRQALDRLIEGGEEMRKLSKRIGKIRDDLWNVEEELSRGALSEDVKGRQRRSLRRMLDAIRSIHQRKWSRRRVAIKPREYETKHPSRDLPSDVIKIKEIEKEALHYKPSEIPAEFHRLVEDYYRSLCERVRGY